MAAVKLCEIEKQYGSQRVLDRLDLEIPQGRYLVLLGPSGCGKTTLLKIVAGLVTPEGGCVSLNGINMDDVPPRRRDVAMVFQGDALYPHLTISQSLDVGRDRKLSQSQWQSRLREAIEIAGISEILKRKPQGLSGGELRRAAVAKAIVRNSGVRLLDEPLSALDANVRHGIGQSLLRWHASNPGTTIHVTHDGQEAMRMADQIAVMDRGRIVQSGSPAEIYNAPVNKTVALAIGSPPMNFVSATSSGGRLRFESSGISVTKQPWFAQDVGLNFSIGFRSESCQPGTQSEVDRQGVQISGQAVRTEMVDGQSFAEIGLPNLTIIAAIDAAVAIGDPVDLFVPRERLHFFDGDSGERVGIDWDAG